MYLSCKNRIKCTYNFFLIFNVCTDEIFYNFFDHSSNSFFIELRRIFRRSLEGQNVDIHSFDCLVGSLLVFSPFLSFPCFPWPLRLLIRREYRHVSHAIFPPTNRYRSRSRSCRNIRLKLRYPFDPAGGSIAVSISFLSTWIHACAASGLDPCSCSIFLFEILGFFPDQLNLSY